MEKETVLTHTYDLLAYLIPQLTKFPKSQKFVLADRIQNLLTDILELLVEAYFSPPAVKRPLLQKANTRLETLRYLIRLAKDLRCLDLRRYEYVQEKIDTIFSPPSNAGAACPSATSPASSGATTTSTGSIISSQKHSAAHTYAMWTTLPFSAIPKLNCGR